jgi:hypothetical protein
MHRYSLPVAAAVAVVGLSVSPVQALKIAIAPQPDRLALTTPVVVTGKVTGIEKDTVDASSPYAGATDKLVYKVAVVKIDKALVGADGVTHIKVGFVPPAPANPNQPGGGFRPGGFRPGFQMPELKEGQQALFFLARHPSGNFYVIPGGGNPVDLTTDEGKKHLEDVNKALAVVADPMKGLKSDKAEVRLDTVDKLLTKYRAYPVLGGEVDEVAIPADQSKLILKTIAEADWKAANAGPVRGPIRRPAFAPNALSAFYQLGLDEKDGWKQPEFPQPQAGAPPVDFNALLKDAFVKWLAGPGKDYVVKKVVEKKK